MKGCIQAYTLMVREANGGPRAIHQTTAVCVALVASADKQRKCNENIISEERFAERERHTHPHTHTQIGAHERKTEIRHLCFVWFLRW